MIDIIFRVPGFDSNNIRLLKALWTFIYSDWEEATEALLRQLGDEHKYGAATSTIIPHVTFDHHYLSIQRYRYGVRTITGSRSYGVACDRTAE